MKWPIQESVNTRRGVERCLKYAFELAKKRRGGKPWKGLKTEDIQRQNRATHPLRQKRTCYVRV